VTIEYTYVLPGTCADCPLCGLVQRGELRYPVTPNTTDEVAVSLAIAGSNMYSNGPYCNSYLAAIYVCGYTNASANGTNDYLVLGYPRVMGIDDWHTTAIHPSLVNGNDTTSKIILSGDIDSNPWVYVTGTAWGGAIKNYDEFTVALNLIDGTLHWFHASDLDGEDRATDLAAVDRGQVYVTGKSFNGTDFDYRTTKVNTIDPMIHIGARPLGEGLWSITYNAPAGGPDAAAAIALLTPGLDNELAEIYVTGRSTSTLLDSSPKYATIKYTETH